MSKSASQDTVYKVQVEIFDESYTIKSTVNQETIKKLALELDGRMREVHARSGYLSTGKTAVLTALHLMHELSKLQEDYDDLIKLLDQQEAK